MPSTATRERWDALKTIALPSRAMAEDCGKGWSGKKGRCIRSQKRVKRLKHVAEHLGENVAAWGVGKVVGGAIAGVATRHGVNPQLAIQISEAAVQGLAATLLHARKKENRSPANLAAEFLSQTAGAFAGKMAHSGVDDAILGGDKQFRLFVSTIAGKGVGAGTVAAAGHTLRKQGALLRGLFDRHGVRADAQNSGFTLTPQEAQAIYELTVAAILLRQRPQKS